MKLFFRIACLALLLSATLADDFGFDLADALDDDSTPPKTTSPPKKNDDMGFDLNDAFGGDEDPFPAKPPVVDPPPNGGGGGGTFNNDDLLNIGGGGHYEPDGGRVPDSGYDSNNRAADQPQGEQGSGPMAGIISAVGVALVGAASSYFAYQKKKLCFKLQGGQGDPERGNMTQRHMTQSEPQVMSNLIQS